MSSKLEAQERHEEIMRRLAHLDKRLDTLAFRLDSVVQALNAILDAQLKSVEQRGPIQQPITANPFGA